MSIDVLCQPVVVMTGRYRELYILLCWVFVTLIVFIYGIRRISSQLMKMCCSDDNRVTTYVPVFLRATASTGRYCWGAY